MATRRKRTAKWLRKRINTEVTAKLKQREIAISKAYKSQAGSVGKGKGTCEGGVK